jgi:8-oxo-dGTP diphosphatase
VNGSGHGETLTFFSVHKQHSSTATIIPWFKESEELNILVIRRKNDPYKGKLALPGGFLEVGEESIPCAAVRELREETGISRGMDSLKLVTVQSDPDRDPRGVIIDHVYSVQISAKDLFYAKAADDAASLELYTIWDRILCNGIGGIGSESFAFDHATSIQKFLERFNREGQ